MQPTTETSIQIAAAAAGLRQAADVLDQLAQAAATVPHGLRVHASVIIWARDAQQTATALRLARPDNAADPQVDGWEVTWERRFAKPVSLQVKAPLHEATTSEPRTVPTTVPTAALVAAARGDA